MANDVDVRFFTGKICNKDAEVRNSFNNFTVCITQNRKNKDGQYVDIKKYVNCSWYGKYAIACANGMKKGTPVTVVGSMEDVSWTNKEGKEVKTEKCICEKVIVTSGAKSFSNTSSKSEEIGYNASVVEETSYAPISDNDIPF